MKIKAIDSIKLNLSREEYVSKYYQLNYVVKSVFNQKEINSLKKEYIKYRKNWSEIPKNSIKNKYLSKDLKTLNIPPSCVDIEVASICDLACPFCYRQFVATPDKIMNSKLVYNLIDQAADLKIPSIKFNWRGEPLMHPKLPDFIKYAKTKGILETLINTNATHLNDDLSKKIIESGLDILIYSFDGGTKETYEKMRPGRFKKNNFERIIKNIKNFHEKKKQMNSFFPRTKIQMILTSETRNEINNFKEIFGDIVDDVSLKQYTERGGSMDDLDDEEKQKIKKKYKKILNDQNFSYMKNGDGDLFISNKRLPCEQPYQRLMVTYDGKVSMCCYDWGSMHTIGYVDDLAIKNQFKEYEDIIKKSKNKKKGFEMMRLKMPNKFNIPNQKVSNLRDIWYGSEIDKVRKAHIDHKIDQLKVCKKCPFKETYSWKKV